MLSKTGKAVALQFVSLGIILLTVFVLSRFYSLSYFLDWLHVHISEYQPWSTICYPLVHAGCNLLLLPAGVLVIGSGFLFGWWKGFLLALTGHLLGATGAFWISRTFGRRFIERHLANRPQWQELDRAIAREGWKIVALSQASPLFPTSLFNYCYGLTRLRYWPCMAWIALGWAPGMFLYTYLGQLGHVGYQAWRTGNQPSPPHYFFWAGGLVASLALTMILAGLAVRLLREARARAREAIPAKTLSPDDLSVR